jgi:hypothetical protein
MTQMVAKLDDLGTPVWVGLLVLSFVVFWPVGLALLAFLLTSGRLGSHRGGWCSGRMSRSHERWARPYWHGQSSNTAFDEYREQALHRLEEEQEEFHDFLKQLRMAKDRTEFDRFMADRTVRGSDDEASDESDTPDDQNDVDDETRTDA